MPPYLKASVPVRPTIPASPPHSPLARTLDAFHPFLAASRQPGSSCTSQQPSIHKKKLCIVLDIVTIHLPYDRQNCQDDQPNRLEANGNLNDFITMKRSNLKMTFGSRFTPETL